MKSQVMSCLQQLSDDDFKKLTETLSRNRITKNFLSVPTHFNLFKNAVYFPTEENLKKINEAFREYMEELQVISYFSKVIEGRKKDFYKKINKQIEQYYESIDEINHPIYLLSQYSEKRSGLRKTEKLEYVIENGLLLEAFNNLTEKQKDILNAVFVWGYKQNEIAKCVNSTPQAISKSYTRAINNLKMSLRGEGTHEKNRRALERNKGRET